MKFCSMDRNAYFRASKLSYEIEVNEQQVEEITSWLESERFEGVVMYFVNEQGTNRNEAVAMEKDLARDVLEYARKKINQVLRKQNQEFKNL